MILDVIILAAGKGTRMKSRLPKVLQPLAGKPLLQHVLDSAATLEGASMHVVIGHGSESVKKAFEHEAVNWVEQTQQLGTGHAVAQALDGLADQSISLVLYGDVPLLKSSTLESLIGKANENNLALLTVNLENPAGYGRIIRNEQAMITAIVEEKDANDQEKTIKECNTGILALPTNKLKTLLPKVGNNNAQKEYYLTDLIALAVDEGMNVIGQSASDSLEVQGVNDKLQLAELERSFQQTVAKQCMKEGLTLVDPARFDLRGNLSFSEDVSIDVNCVFQGDVEIGSNVSIGPNCVIGTPGKKVTIGNNVTINAFSVIEEAEIGNQCNIGPYARLRPGTTLADHAKIGNFVETKKANIGRGSKVNHLSYVGDSELGNDVNVGAGTITCNYDGVNKHKTTIGNNAFIGSNTAIVAPVNIHENATIAAGSTVTKDVDENELAIARAKQKNIKGWPRPTKEDKD